MTLLVGSLLTRHTAAHCSPLDTAEIPASALGGWVPSIRLSPVLHSEHSCHALRTDPPSCSTSPWQGSERPWPTQSSSNHFEAGLSTSLHNHSARLLCRFSWGAGSRALCNPGSALCQPHSSSLPPIVFACNLRADPESLPSGVLIQRAPMRSPVCKQFAKHS